MKIWARNQLRVWASESPETLPSGSLGFRHPDAFVCYLEEMFLEWKGRRGQMVMREGEGRDEKGRGESRRQRGKGRRGGGREE